MFGPYKEKKANLNPNLVHLKKRRLTVLNPQIPKSSSSKKESLFSSLSERESLFRSLSNPNSAKEKKRKKITNPWLSPKL